MFQSRSPNAKGCEITSAYRKVIQNTKSLQKNPNWLLLMEGCLYQFTQIKSKCKHFFLARNIKACSLHKYQVVPEPTDTRQTYTLLKIVLRTFEVLLHFIFLTSTHQMSITRSLAFLRCFQVSASLINTAHHSSPPFTLPRESQHPPEQNFSPEDSKG